MTQRGASSGANRQLAATRMTSTAYVAAVSPLDGSTCLTDIAARYAPEVPLIIPEGRGRKPPRWDEPGILILLALLENGLPRSEALALVHLPYRTFARWMQQGQAEAESDLEGVTPPTVYRHIWQSVVRAEALLALAAVALVIQAARRGSWKAAAWMLERRFPEMWGPPKRRPRGPADEAPAPDHVRVDEAALMRKIDAVLARRNELVPVPVGQLE